MTDENIPAEISPMLAELDRIYGDTPRGKRWFLPFATPDETTAWLKAVPSGAGDAGIQAALERHLGHALPQDSLGAITPTEP